MRLSIENFFSKSDCQTSKIKKKEKKTGKKSISWISYRVWNTLWKCADSQSLCKTKKKTICTPRYSGKNKPETSICLENLLKIVKTENVFLLL